MRRSIRHWAIPLVAGIALIPITTATIGNTNTGYGAKAETNRYAVTEILPAATYKETRPKSVVERHASFPYIHDIERVHQGLGFRRSEIAAVGYVESRFDSTAVSGRHARNVWQLTRPGFNEVYEFLYSADPHYARMRRINRDIASFAGKRFSGNRDKDWLTATTSTAANADISFAYLALRERAGGSLMEGLRDYSCGPTGKKKTDFDDEYVERYEMARNRFLFLDDELSADNVRM